MGNDISPKTIEIAEFLNEFGDEINEEGYGLLFILENHNERLKSEVAISSIGVSRGAVMKFIENAISDSDDIFDEVTKIIGKAILEKGFKDKDENKALD